MSSNSAVHLSKAGLLFEQRAGSNCVQHGMSRQEENAPLHLLQKLLVDSQPLRHARLYFKLMLPNTLAACATDSNVAPSRTVSDQAAGANLVIKSTTECTKVFEVCTLTY